MRKTLTIVLRNFFALVILGGTGTLVTAADSSDKPARKVYQTVAVMKGMPAIRLAGGPDEDLITVIDNRRPAMPFRPNAAASPGTVVGYTYYDMQHNGSTGRQVAESGGKIQISYMRQSLPQISPGRVVNWNAVDVTGSPISVVLDNGGSISILPLSTPSTDTGITVNPTPVQQGYTTMDLMPSGEAAVYFHASGEVWSLIDSLVPGTWPPNWGIAGFLSDIPQPPSFDPVIWPKSAVEVVGVDTVSHVLGYKISTPVHDELYYWRGVLKSRDLFGDGWPEVDYFSHGPIFIDSISTTSYVIEEDPGSDRVAIVYAKPFSTSILGFAGQQLNNAAYRESTDGGLSWNEPTLITNQDTLTNGHWVRADLDAVYDDNNNLHIVYTTQGWAEIEPGTFARIPNLINLWHWNSERQTSRRIAGGHWTNPCAFGDSTSMGVDFWNLAYAKPSISYKPVNEGAGDGIADEVIYITWTQLGPTETDCSNSGWTNGELYCSASSDGGNSWDAPLNISGTETPGCAPGDCLSEHWSTAARRVDSGLYLSYLEDTHAGAIPQSHGLFSLSAYKIYALEARSPGADARMIVSPVEPQIWGDPFWTNLVIDTPLSASGAVLNLKICVSNPGTAELNFNAEVAADFDGPDFMTINGISSYNGTIAAGAAPETLIVQIDPAGLDVVANFKIEITSNAVQRTSGTQASAVSLVFRVGVACPIVFTGDVDLTGTLTSTDIISMVNYVFKSGPEPLPCPAAGDTDCTGSVNSSDIIFMVNHVFKSGPQPCDVCTLIPGTWSCP